MKPDIPNLFVEINEINYIFVVGKYDESYNLKIIDKIVVPIEEIKNNNFINIEQAQDIVKKNIHLIENKLNYVFNEVTIILDKFDCSHLSISGFKKLNGSQVLKENISYILNSMKSIVKENEKEKTILHIFNSKSVLDGSVIDNLPIGSYGDFYIHELTFLLINNNDLKNTKLIFERNNLKVKKIIVKNFIECSQIIDKYHNEESFFKIKINKDRSNLSFFEKSSFKYIEHFNFGTNIILQDIIKVCAIDFEIINKILLDKYFDKNDYKDEDLVEEKYFDNKSYRKIRKKLILDIVSARIEEITNIIINKNINLQDWKKKRYTIYISLEDELIFNNFEKIFISHVLQNDNCKAYFINDFEIDTSIIKAAYLEKFGWKKEAIPIIQTKNSLITRIFKSLFG